MDRAVTLDLKREVIHGQGLLEAIGVAFFVIATALGAYVRIPIEGTPVPVTLQTFFVLLSGGILGKRLGSASQSIYCALGLAGLPVFQGYSFGIAHLLGPTGGYLIGFIGASYAVGSIIERNPLSAYRAVLALLAGVVVIYSFGVAWLTFLYGINAAHAIRLGVLPFLLPELAKFVFAVAAYRTVSRRSRQIFAL